MLPVVPVATERSTDQTTRVVVVAYVVLAAAPFIVAAAHSWFWDEDHRLAPVATVIAAALLLALVMRRRWAWALLAVFEAAVLISFAFDFTNALALGANLASLALLVSPWMRRYVA